MDDDLKTAESRVEEDDTHQNAYHPEGQMQCPDRLRLPLSFDADQLAADLVRLSATRWIDHFVTQNYEGSWSVIPLRAPAGARHPVKMIYADPTATDFEDTPMLAECPYFRAVLSSLACPLQAVRLMRLTPGSVIREHTDLDLSFERGSVRLHIPVITNAGVEFDLNRRRVIMEAGSCWYLRLSDPHRVANRGETDRVHLVIDAAVNDWVASLFAAAMRE
ncbi:aspartyl/asparaginyl beta-hydroxylase domain-containing protein [Bradyrhizobium guangzhouense]|nr:aspartyl/asparaginyl beta-hydroxylase domain-containing protein [Bradyrhizobium guangzhouense]